MRTIGLLVAIMTGGGVSMTAHSRPTSAEVREARIETMLRQVNTLLAEHPSFVAPFGFGVTTLVVDGGYLIKVYDDPTVVADGEDWMAEIVDLRAEVKEQALEGHRPSYDIQCRAEGPLRPERMNRCWWLGDRTDRLVPDGDLWHHAGPVASRAIREGIEEMITLLRERDR